MHHLNRHILVLIRMLAFSVALLSATVSKAETLTSDQVQSFIDAQRDLAEIEQELPMLANQPDTVPDFEHLLSSNLPTLEEYPAAERRIEEIVGKHGFNTIGDWASVGDRVYRAVMAISVAEMPPEQRRMMESMLDTENNTEIPEQMRAQAKQMAEQTRAMLKAADNAPEEDIATVRPFMGQLAPEAAL